MISWNINFKSAFAYRNNNDKAIEIPDESITKVYEIWKRLKKTVFSTSTSILALRYTKDVKKETRDNSTNE